VRWRTLLADSAPPDMRDTAYGFINLMYGIALLIASALAGPLRDRLGASFKFYAGAAICLIALFGLAWSAISARSP
jgi:predicted MFS family arabinose efflux permease